MYRRPLTDTVSLQELQTMRERGMTNREIAQSLDVGYSTVCRYLGKQPDGMRAAHGTYTRKASESKRLEEKQAIDWEKAMQQLQKQQEQTQPEEPQEEPQATPEEWQGGLRVVTRILQAESATARYNIDANAGTVKVSYKDAQAVRTYNKEQLDAYITELMEILDMMN